MTDNTYEAEQKKALCNVYDTIITNYPPSKKSSLTGRYVYLKNAILTHVKDRLIYSRSKIIHVTIHSIVDEQKFSVLYKKHTGTTLPSNFCITIKFDEDGIVQVEDNNTPKPQTQFRFKETTQIR